MMMMMICVTDCHVMSASGSVANAVIPLSVEMLSDSDDEDHKPTVSSSSTNQHAASAGAATTVDGKSKLLLLKMASEFVEAAAAAATVHTPTQRMSAVIIDELLTAIKHRYMKAMKHRYMTLLLCTCTVMIPVHKDVDLRSSQDFFCVTYVIDVLQSSLSRLHSWLNCQSVSIRHAF